MDRGHRLALAKPFCEACTVIPARVSHAIPSQGLSMETGAASLDRCPGWWQHAVIAVLAVHALPAFPIRTEVLALP